MPRILVPTLTPFLYPCLDSSWARASQSARRVGRTCALSSKKQARPKCFHTAAASAPTTTQPADDHEEEADVDHARHSPTDYSSTPFTDACALTIAAGAGGHGCISFLREKYIDNGPPNGGDGGSGGSIYIQAVKGETSLHKLARRGVLKAGRGKNGQGSMKGGARGNDIVITVPVGTVVREVSRIDPVADEERKYERPRSYLGEAATDDIGEHSEFRRDKWLIYPGTLPKSWSTAEIPALPRPRRSHLASVQPQAPFRLDLDKPMDAPMVLAAGAMGGFGNPHFVTKSLPWPKFATKGDEGMRINLQLELKLLADVGLVGLPNAGKSTLLRAVTRSRTRVGNWAFTTLSPNIGTVVLDTYTGRPTLDTKGRRQEPRTNFTVADIPGLIEDAHMDRGLGLGFLRHIERAAVLAFVVDLSAREAVDALKDLWHEVSEFENLREREVNAEIQRLQNYEDSPIGFEPFGGSVSPGFSPEPIRELKEAATLNSPDGRALPALSLPPISSKPWLVVGTKADLKGTQENFARLRSYLENVELGTEAHPSGKQNGWRKKIYSLPVSAINKEGVSGFAEIILGLLDA